MRSSILVFAGLLVAGCPRPVPVVVSDAPPDASAHEAQVDATDEARHGGLVDAPDEARHEAHVDASPDAPSTWAELHRAHYRAIGGTTTDVHNRQLRVRGRVNLPAEKAATFVHVRGPGSSYTEWRVVDDAPRGPTYTRDSVRAVSLDGEVEPIVVHENELDLARKQALELWDLALRAPWPSEASSEAEPGTLEGEPVWSVHTPDANAGRGARYLYHAETGLLLAKTLERPDGTPVTYRFGYEQAGELRLPVHVRVSHPAFPVTIRIEEVEWDTEDTLMYRLERALER